MLTVSLFCLEVAGVNDIKTWLMLDMHRLRVEWSAGMTHPIPRNTWRAAKWHRRGLAMHAMWIFTRKGSEQSAVSKAR